MLLDDKIEDLEKLTERKITYEEIAPILNLGSKQAVQNRISRKQQLKSYEITALDKAFETEINKKNQVVDCIEIDQIHINPSCGKGTAVLDEPEVTPVKLGTQLIQTILKISDPKNLKTFKASGDSMESIIEDGDLLLVDTGRTDFANGGIFLLTINNDWFVKRLRKRLSGELDVISDNTKYPVETFKPDDDIEIVVKGRVIKNLSRGL